MNEIDTVAKAAYSRGAQTFSYYEEPWWRTYRFKSGIFSDAPHFPIPFLFSIFIDFPSTFRSSNFSNFYLCFFFTVDPFSTALGHSIASVLGWVFPVNFYWLITVIITLIMCIVYMLTFDCVLRVLYLLNFTFFLSFTVCSSSPRIAIVF
jgi:hypothetical protein